LSARRGLRFARNVNDQIDPRARILALTPRRRAAIPPPLLYAKRDAIMRHWQAVLLALLAGPLAGCHSVSGDRPADGPGLAPLQGPTGDDVVQLYVALIERPARDPVVNGKLWEMVDEESVRLERAVDPVHQALLADNGFRIGQVAGSPPAELYAMLNSARSCANPRRISLHAGKTNDFALGPVWSHCQFQLQRNGRTTTVELDQARCQLEVVPTLGGDGRILLHFTPVIKHGRPGLATKPIRDPSGTRYWEMQVEQDAETYAWLGWDLSVSENEYVLIGCRPDAPDTLGTACFVNTEAATPAQRLLVLRVGRALTDGPPADEATAAAAPLALQARWTAMPTIVP
jgi:hypothetical protein